MHIHSVPVDPSLTPDEAWQEILEHGRRVTYSVHSDDGMFDHCSCCAHRRSPGGCGGPRCPCRPADHTWKILRCERPDCVDRS